MSDDFQLGLLPEKKINWRTLVTSYGLVCLLLLFLVSASFLWPDKIEFHQRFTLTEVIPTPEAEPQAPKPPPILPPKIIAKLPPVEVQETPKIVLPKVVRVQPKPVPRDVEPPKLEARFSSPVLMNVSTPRPAKLLYTGSFGSSAVATLNASAEKVQTGGFGATDGLKGQGKPGAHLETAQLGSFDSPQGPGKGNGMGGAKGLQGTVSNAGFGNGVAQSANGGHPHAVVAQTAFNSPEVAPANAKRSLEEGPATLPIEITYKPKPTYTEEARKLQVEGEVLLEVVFGANGQLHVNRVVRGLGHGLDEAAIVAANNMRFRPAQRNGAPVDSTAVVHVTFELAM